MKQLLILVALTLSLQSYAQDDNTVTLVVSGQGKTQDEARQNALRSAIEQAFGTFISSETVINNDSFVSDNITSLSQGSVLNFEILSSNLFPDSTISLTMMAVVSITQMQKLTESKGHSATIAGGLFGMNLKLLQLQSDAEEKVIADMAKKSLLILQESIDFNLEVQPPRKSDLRVELQAGLSEGSYDDYWKNTGELKYDNIYKIRFVIECRPNSNLDVFIDYFLNTLNSIKMSDSEIDFAEKSGSKFYKLIQYENENEVFYSLRNSKSISLIDALFKSATLNLVNYDIISNDDIIHYTPIFKKGLVQDGDQNYKLITERSYDRDIQILDSSHYVFIHGYLNERKINTIQMAINYPSDISGPYNREYGIQLKRVKSDTWLASNGVISHSYLRFQGEKYTPTSEHMNVRYQVIDYFLPLSDVEKLVSIKVSRHHE